MPECVDRGRRRLLLNGATWLGLCATATAAAPVAARRVTPCPPRQRQVGINYSLWHQDTHWQDSPHRSWGTPSLGFYRSDDPRVLARHADMLSGAGVDFAILDWSNNLAVDLRRRQDPSIERFIEQSTLRMFDVWGRRASPRIALMIGNPQDPDAIRNGRLIVKADEVHDLFVADPARRGLLQSYLGKPLLLVYVNTPSPWPAGTPPWRDDRFTVRFVTGFITQQPGLLGPPAVSRYGYWSWEDRHQPTYSILDGQPECMTVVAAWRGAGSPGRDSGRTFTEGWQYARSIGPRFVIAGTFNEWWVSEQPSGNQSKDLEPSYEFGPLYINLLKQQASLFKSGL